MLKQRNEYIFSFISIAWKFVNNLPNNCLFNCVFKISTYVLQLIGIFIIFKIKNGIINIINGANIFKSGDNRLYILKIKRNIEDSFKNCNLSQDK